MSRINGVPNTLGSMLRLNAGVDGLRPIDWTTPDIEMEFIGKLWPMSSYGGLDSSGFGGIMEANPWEYNDYVSGARTAWKVTGTTRDVYGTALPYCTVKLYNTALSLNVDTAISGPDGSYSLFTTYRDGHFVVAYLSGSPDVTGATVNTLIPV